MASLQTCPAYRDFKFPLSVKFHPATCYLFLVLLLLLLVVPSLVQVLEFVTPSTLEPVQLIDPPEHGFCYFSQCKELYQLMREEE